jgi:hypothetical protein
MSWWDMEKFSALAFFRIAESLSSLSTDIENKGYADNEPQEFKPKGAAYAIFSHIKEQCEKIGLKISPRCIDDIVERGAKGVSPAELKQLVDELLRIIKWEMADKLFMFIPSDRAAYHDQKELLGRDVNAKFPSIQFDATEAGNCYACGRSTAVVFHLMRIMEIGVQAFGTKFGVPLASEKNWQNILDEINKKIKTLQPKTPAIVEMSNAAANLYAVKLAWRNEVMHPNDTYTLEEAENLIRHVKMFMKQLATII